MKKYTILIDNGHGVETPGKRSPDDSLREYAYTRQLAKRLVASLSRDGYHAQQIVTEEADVSLRERCARVNEICKREGAKNVLLVSLHNNAKGSGVQWENARGWSAHVSLNSSTASRDLARSLITAAEQGGLKVRRSSPSEPYWRQNLAMCRDTLCPAVLTENLFQDNREDVAWLLTEDGVETLVNIHATGIKRFINSLL